jgi:serine/threonine protein kinase
MEHVPNIEELQRARDDLDAIELVAVGGFKAVFKATGAKRTEAVKLVYIPPESEEETSRDEIVARVKREIDVLRHCTSNKLVKLGSIEMETVSIGGHDYLIYSEEFLTGESLKQRISARYRPGLDELRILGFCLAEALQDIERTGHIHRDVKPGNVMATDLAERPFVLLDLGIAFKLRGTDLTLRGGGPPGTLRYMAPELLTPDYKNALDIRSDIYSAGVTIFEYAAGEHPIVGRAEDAVTTALAIIQRPAKKLQSLRGDLPEVFCSAIERCIKKLPALRYPNPKTLLQELEGIR